MDDLQSADSLLSFVDTISKSSRLRVEDDLGDGFVRLRVSEAERRQAKQDIRCVEDAVIELLRNARDAHAAHVFLASSRSGNIRTLTLIDDGDGIPDSMRELVFEPRVTSKLDTMRMDEWGVHGRGMALYSIQQNAESAGVLDSIPSSGTAIQVIFNCSKLNERSDQSTAPVLVKDPDGSMSLGSSPHNILRTCVQFALAEADTRRAGTGCRVFFGSPVEIAASLNVFGKRILGMAVDSSDAQGPLPLCAKLAGCSDAAEFSAVASSLGLPLSARSAYRIMQGQVAGAGEVLSGLAVKDAAPRKRKVDLSRDYRGLSIHQDDLDAFMRGLSRAYADLAERYYLESDIAPEIKIAHDCIRVEFPLRKQL